MSDETLERPSKALPREPTEAMIAAIEEHFRKWQKIERRSDSWFKAQCWDALQAYYRMWEAA